MKQSASDAGVTAANRRTRYLPYLKAQDILHKRINATAEDMAGWVWCGPKDGGLVAYLNANELDPPPRFYFQYGGPGSSLNYMAELLGCWFLATDLEEFSPTSRFISGAVLRDRWMPLLGSADAVVNFIAAKEQESRILPIHPLTGETNISGGDYMPDWTTALFVLSHVEAIEAEEFPADALPNQTSAAGAGRKGGRPKGRQRELLQRIIHALATWAEENGESFDSKSMPGQVGDADTEGSFHWLCAKLYPGEFRKSDSAFRGYRANLCTFQPYAKASDFYSRAIAHIAQTIGVSLNAKNKETTGRKTA